MLTTCVVEAERLQAISVFCSHNVRFDSSALGHSRVVFAGNSWRENDDDKTENIKEMTEFITLCLQSSIDQVQATGSHGNLR